MAISVETISVNRYAPRGSEAVNLYSNGLEGGDHLTIGQLVIAVAMRAAAAYEAQSVTKMNVMAADTAVLARAADYMEEIVNETDKAIIDRYHSRSGHKRRPISTFENP